MRTNKIFWYEIYIPFRVSSVPNIVSVLYLLRISIVYLRDKTDQKWT